MKMFILLTGAWLLGCASQRPLQQTEVIGPDPRNLYRVELINENTIAVRVEDPLTGRVVRVYPGQRAVLTLPPTVILPRRLLLTVGPRTYQTMEFRPDQALRCWTLTIDATPHSGDRGRPIAPCRGDDNRFGRREP